MRDFGRGDRWLASRAESNRRAGRTHEPNGRAAASTPKGFVGIYLQRSSEPIEARFRLDIRADGSWVMANRLSGWWGTWEEKDGKFLLTGTVGPTGKVPKLRTNAVEFSHGDTVQVADLTFGPAAGNRVGRHSVRRRRTQTTRISTKCGLALDFGPFIWYNYPLPVK